MKDLMFIDIVDQTGRASSLGIYGKKKDKQGKQTISIVGGLSHYDEIAPRSIADADKLIRWLQEWKDEQKEK